MPSATRAFVLGAAFLLPLLAAEAARADEVIGAPPSASASSAPAPATAQSEAHAAALGPVATSADQTAPIGPAGKKRWYGWQTLITDGAGFALMIGGASTKSAAAAGFGLAAYGFGGPIVHWAHGNVGRGFASLGIRGGAPLLVGLGTMAAFADRNDGWSSLGYFAIGFVTGMFGAVAVDAAVLARDHVEPEEPPKAAGLRVQMAPSVAPVRGGAVGGLQGAF